MIVALPALFPILVLEVVDPPELASVVRDENRSTRQGDGRDHKITTSAFNRVICEGPAGLSEKFLGPFAGAGLTG